MIDMQKCSTCDMLELTYTNYFQVRRKRKINSLKELTRGMVRTTRPGGELKLIPDRAYCSRNGKYIGEIGAIRKSAPHGWRVMLRNTAQVECEKDQEKKENTDD